MPHKIPAKPVKSKPKAKPNPKYKPVKLSKPITKSQLVKPKPKAKLSNFWAEKYGGPGMTREPPRQKKLVIKKKRVKPYKQ